MSIWIYVNMCFVGEEEKNKQTIGADNSECQYSRLTMKSLHTNYSGFSSSGSYTCIKRAILKTYKEKNMQIFTPQKSSLQHFAPLVNQKTSSGVSLEFPPLFC